MDAFTEQYKPYRRFIFAILLQAVQDAKGEGRDAESAKRFLEAHGSSYLELAGISRPDVRLQEFLAQTGEQMRQKSAGLQRRRPTEKHLEKTAA